MKVEEEIVDLQRSLLRRSDKLSGAREGDVNGHLEMVFLLADERLVMPREIESLIGIDSVRCDGTKEKKNLHCLISAINSHNVTVIHAITTTIATITIIHTSR